MRGVFAINNKVFGRASCRDAEALRARGRCLREEAHAEALGRGERGEEDWRKRFTRRRGERKERGEEDWGRGSRRDAEALRAQRRGLGEGPRAETRRTRRKKRNLDFPFKPTLDKFGVRTFFFFSVTH